VPPGWAVFAPATSVDVHQASRGYQKPAAVASDLHFDGYSRGVNRGVRGARLGMVEVLSQFRQPSGATAWYDTFLAGNEGPETVYSRNFPIGTDGHGFISKHLDDSGYHYGTGVALVGDIVVHLRLFGTTPVDRAEIVQRLHQAERPVERGISGQPSAPLQGGGKRGGTTRT
jgi:hypothetical protein